MIVDRLYKTPYKIKCFKLLYVQSKTWKNANKKVGKTLTAIYTKATSKNTCLIIFCYYLTLTVLPIYTLV